MISLSECYWLYSNLTSDDSDNLWLKIARLSTFTHYLAVDSSSATGGSEHLTVSLSKQVMLLLLLLLRSSSSSLLL